MSNISSIIGNYGRQTHINESSENKRLELLEKQKTDKASEIKPKKSDVVSLSRPSQEMQVAMDAVKNAPEVRIDKVNELKLALQKGTYEINPDKIAGKMIGLVVNKVA